MPETWLGNIQRAAQRRDVPWAVDVSTPCGVIWVMCRCNRPTGHEGAHRCAVEACRNVWTGRAYCTRCGIPHAGECLRGDRR